MSTLEDSLNGSGLGSPSHASSPVSSLDDLSATRESGLGEDAGTSSWLPDEGRDRGRGRKDGGGGERDDGEEEDSEEEEIIMEEFRCAMSEIGQLSAPLIINLTNIKASPWRQGGRLDSTKSILLIVQIVFDPLNLAKIRQS